MLELIYENPSNEGYNMFDENEILIKYPPQRIFKKKL